MKYVLLNGLNLLYGRFLIFPHSNLNETYSTVMTSGYQYSLDNSSFHQYNSSDTKNVGKKKIISSHIETPR